MLWEYLRSEEFKEAIEKCNGVCAIPIGCLEAHSVHLLSGCDTLSAKEFTKRAAEKEPVCVFPAMYFGEKNGAGQYPGTVIFPITLIWDILEEIEKYPYLTEDDIKVLQDFVDSKKTAGHQKREISIVLIKKFIKLTIKKVKIFPIPSEFFWDCK